MSSIVQASQRPPRSKQYDGALQARLNFLRVSANHLALTAPTTSSLLNSKASALLEENEIDAKSKKSFHQARPTCGACGNLFIPGLTCKIFLERTALRNDTSKKNRAATRGYARKQTVKEARKIHVTECGLCNAQIRTGVEYTAQSKHSLMPVDPSKLKAEILDRFQESTKHDVAATHRSNRVSIPSRPAYPGPGPAAAATADLKAPSGANRSAKERAKARKKSGLQAQLAKTKTLKSTTDQDFGLNLMDFMQDD